MERVTFYEVMTSTFAACDRDARAHARTHKHWIRSCGRRVKKYPLQFKTSDTKCLWNAPRKKKKVPLKCRYDLSVRHIAYFAYNIAYSWPRLPCRTACVDWSRSLLYIYPPSTYIRVYWFWILETEFEITHWKHPLRLILCYVQHANSLHINKEGFLSQK